MEKVRLVLEKVYTCVYIRIICIGHKCTSPHVLCVYVCVFTVCRRRGMQWTSPQLSAHALYQRLASYLTISFLWPSIRYRKALIECSNQCTPTHTQHVMAGSHVHTTQSLKRLSISHLQDNDFNNSCRCFESLIPQ